MQLTYLYLLSAYVEQTVSKDNSVWVMGRTAVGVEFYGLLPVKGIHKNRTYRVQSFTLIYIK